MKFTNYVHYLLLAAVVLVSCKKDPGPQPEPSAQTGAVTLKFENMVGSLPLQLSSTQYTTASGDTFTVTLYNYYISNIRLTATDNSIYSETESYHLVSTADPSSLQFTLPDVPVKNYSSITFMIGVDSVRNVSGAQTGALDPAHGMFWSWNSGYIMTKLECESPQSTAPGNIVQYHIGGFSGPDNSLRTVTLNFPNQANVSTTVTPRVIMRSDISEWFKTPSLISISNLNTVNMPGANASLIASNYADMFSVSAVEN